MILRIFIIIIIIIILEKGGGGGGGGGGGMNILFKIILYSKNKNKIKKKRPKLTFFILMYTVTYIFCKLVPFGYNNNNIM